MKELIEVLKEINNEVDYENEKDLVGSGAFSSLEILNVITTLEEEYDIEIPPTEIIIDNFRSVKAINDLVERLKE